VQTGGDLTLKEATISGGYSTSQGGGVYNKDGTVTIENSTISGNAAYQFSTVAITNSTISSTTTTSGGGVANFAASGTAMLTINNSTIYGNFASYDGGGVHNLVKDGTAEVNLSHSIVSGNTATTGAGNEVYNDGGTVNADDYNLFGNNSEDNDEALDGFTPGGSDITATSNGTDPTALGDILDTTLADNGGPTETHALVPGSPAIDAGDPAIPSPPEFDQRGPGFPRVVNGVIDIGAYEVQPPPVPPEPVGGIVVPVNRLGLLAPWLGLGGLVATAVAAVAARLRRSG
jgi:hypothetical protein